MSDADVITTERFVLFWRGWPSQWFASPFTVEGVYYRCCEQYMMAEKVRVFGDEEVLEKILAAVHPREQKALGRKVWNFDAEVWNSACRGIVFAANLEKFSQNQALHEKLLATGGRVIVEASPVDTIWGIGLAPEDPDAQRPERWRGTNWLGMALMQVRDVLAARAKGTSEVLPAELMEQLGKRRVLVERNG